MALDNVAASFQPVAMIGPTVSVWRATPGKPVKKFAGQARHDCRTGNPALSKISLCRGMLTLTVNAKIKIFCVAGPLQTDSLEHVLLFEYI